MADVTLYQLSQAADANGAGTPLWAGFYLLWLKDNLVTNGATVLGSGDGLSRFGHVDAATTVPLAQQGSGGDYDCWSVGNTTNGVAGGAGNAGAWCHLQLPNGKHLFFGAGSFGVAYYGTVGHAIDGQSFDGTAAAASTPPTPTGGVVWSVGSSTTSGTNIMPSTTAAGDILHFDLIILDGGNEWCAHSYYYDDSLATYARDTNDNWQGIVSVENPHPDDTDPWYCFRASPVSVAFAAWNYEDAVSNTNIGQISNINPNDTRTSPDTIICFPYTQDCNNTVDVEKGVANRDMVMSVDGTQSWGFRLTDVESSRVYIQPTPGIAPLLIRWPDTATSQVGASYTDVNAWDPFYANAVDNTADFTVTAYDPLTTPNATIVSTSTTLDFNIDSSLGSVDPSTITITLDGNVIWDGSSFVSDFAGSSFSAGAGTSQDLSLVKATPWADSTRYELVINLT